MSGAVPPPTARSLRRAAGVPRPVCSGCGRCGRGDPAPVPQCAPLLRAPGGGASCLGVGRPGSGALPPSTARPLRAAGAHYPLAVGAGGVRAWGPVTNPTARALACCGGGMRVPGGGASCLGVGRPGSGALPPPTARPLGRLPGPTTNWLSVRGVAGLGTRHQPHSARSCVLWGRHEGARGGAPCLGVGRPGSGALPPPTARPLRGLSGPTTHWLSVRGGAGVGTRHQTHSARSCELALRAVGEARGRPGGAPPTWVWGVRGRALSHPRLPALWVGCRGPLPTGCGCGGVQAWGPVTNPTARALACCGGGMRAPGGGASCLGVGRPGSNALPPPTARPLGGLPGPTTHWLWVRGAAAVGTRHQPHSARSCVLWGRHEGARGGRLLPGCGASGVGRSPTPGLPALWAGCRGQLPAGCGGRDPSLTPQRALLRAGFARCGGCRRAPGGGASCLGVGRPGSGALPPPTARPLGGLPGHTTHWLWVRGGCGPGDPSPTPQRALLRAVGAARGCPGGAPPAWVWGVRGRALSHPRLPALWAGCRGPLPTGCGCGGVRAWGPVTNPTARALACCGGGMRAPGGGRLLPGCGASGVGRSPTSDCPPSRGAAGAHYPLAVGAGGCGRGDRSPTPQRALLRAGFARCGGGTRAPGGGASCLSVGCPGSGALPPPTARSLGGLPGPTIHWCGCRGVRACGPVTNPIAGALARCGGGMRAPGGGRLLPGCGASGVGRSPTADCPPSGRAAGAHYPLAVGAGGWGREDPSPTPQRALLRAVGAA